MKTTEMIRCLSTVADYMKKQDDSPECAGDLWRIAEYLEESSTNNNRQADAGVKSLPIGKELRDLARQYAEEKFGGMGSDISLNIIHLAELDFQKTVFWLQEKGFQRVAT